MKNVHFPPAVLEVARLSHFQYNKFLKWEFVSSEGVHLYAPDCEANPQNRSKSLIPTGGGGIGSY
jgi:hypothetical protein